MGVIIYPCPNALNKTKLVNGVHEINQMSCYHPCECDFFIIQLNPEVQFNLMWVSSIGNTLWAASIWATNDGNLSRTCIQTMDSPDEQLQFGQTVDMYASSAWLTNSGQFEWHIVDTYGSTIWVTNSGNIQRHQFGKQTVTTWSRLFSADIHSSWW